MNLFTCGNLKIGKDTLIFNFMPARDCPSKKLGLCLVGCNCYARKSEIQYPDVITHRIDQATYWNISSIDDFCNKVIKKVKAKNRKVPIKYLRINESGDFRNQGDIIKLDVIAEILKKHSIIVYCYTARSDLNFNNVSFVVNGSSFMLDNNFKFIPKGHKDKGLDTTCEGNCFTCKLCKVKGHKVIGINQH